MKLVTGYYCPRCVSPAKLLTFSSSFTQIPRDVISVSSHGALKVVRRRRAEIYVYMIYSHVANDGIIYLRRRPPRR
jgi:hypothetical protein